MIFLFATDLEAQQFRAACPHAQIEICGVGAAQCAATTALIIAKMREKGATEKLVLAGIAGSYNLDQVALCEVVEVISEQIEALPARFGKCYTVPAQTCLRAVSSNSVNRSGEGASSCIKAQIENMEGAAFMAICEQFKIPATEIRAISNRVGDPFEQWRVSEACEALSEVLSSFVAHQAD